MADTSLVTNAVDADPALKLLSKSKLVAALRKLNAGTTKAAVTAAVDAWLAANRDVNRERFARPSTRFKQAKITAPPFSFQIDVAFLPAYKAANRGRDSFLLVVDILSRKAWAYVLKSGKTADVLTAYRRFLADAKEGKHWEPTVVEGDDYFDASAFMDFNRKRAIPVVTGVAATDHIASGDRLGIVDRLTRTLKALIARKVAADDDPKWTAWLPDIMRLYNGTVHDNLTAATGKPTTPDELYADRRAAYYKWVRESDANGAVAAKVASKFKPGDYVRRKLAKAAFAKEGFNMSLEIYRVTAVKGTRISVVDTADGKPYGRALKPNELTQVAAPSTEAAPAAAVAPAVAKRARVVKKIRSRAVGIEPATEAAVQTPLETRGQRASRRLATKAPAPEATAAAGTDDHFEVGSIIGDKAFIIKGKRVTKYKVRWAAPYDDPSYDTYEPKSHLSRPGPKALLEQYLRRKRNRAAV